MFRKLTSERLTEQVEDQLLEMGKHLIKINRHKLHASCFNSYNLSETNGRIDLSRHRLNLSRHSHMLASDTNVDCSVCIIASISYYLT